MPAAVSLIEPIFDAQLDSVRLSHVIAMDETPVKAGRAGPGKMKAAYFWPVVGEQDEICFLYYPSRAAKHIEYALGLTRPNGAVLQSDGYSAYAHYAKQTGITHAQCWAHSRRKAACGLGYSALRFILRLTDWFDGHWGDPVWGRRPTTQLLIALAVRDFASGILDTELRSQIHAAADKAIAMNSQAVAKQ